MGDHKGALQVSPKVSVGLHGPRLRFVAPCDREISLGPLGNTTSQEACKNVTNEFSHEILYYVTSEETVGNDIKLGMEIPTIESRASNISPDKGNCIQD